MYELPLHKVQVVTSTGVGTLGTGTHALWHVCTHFRRTNRLFVLYAQMQECLAKFKKQHVLCKLKCLCI